MTDYQFKLAVVSKPAGSLQGEEEAFVAFKLTGPEPERKQYGAWVKADTPEIELDSFLHAMARHLLKPIIKDVMEETFHVS
jgi:hypothetical protein